MNQLIHCKNCDALFMKTPFDRYPEYRLDPLKSSDPVQLIEKDDFEEFLVNHRGHQLENLEIIEDSFVSDKAYAEPVKTSFFKATNGKDEFVVKKIRENISDPLTYSVFDGDYSLRCTDIEIQSNNIIRQLKRECMPPLSETQITAFLQLFQNLTRDVDIEALERITEESSHPLEVYYKMDDLHLMYLLRNCHTLFAGDAYAAVEAFIQRHKEDGVLLLKAMYKIYLYENVKANREKAETTASLSLKKKISGKE